MWIYLVTNTLNGKQYVGQTTTAVSHRFRRHCWVSNGTRAISAAIRKHGKQHFTIATLAECESQEELDASERRFIAELGTLVPRGYNLTEGGKTGGAPRDEVRAKISAANKGRKRSAQTRAKLSASHLGNQHAPDTKHRISEALKGRAPSVATRQAAQKAASKTYVMLSPDGSRLTITNMRLFCKERGWSPSKVSEVVQGKRDMYRGWRVLSVESSQYVGRREARRRLREIEFKK